MPFLIITKNAPVFIFLVIVNYQYLNDISHRVMGDKLLKLLVITHINIIISFKLLIANYFLSKCVWLEFMMFLKSYLFRVCNMSAGNNHASESCTEDWHH